MRASEKAGGATGPNEGRDHDQTVARGTPPGGGVIIEGRTAHDARARRGSQPVVRVLHGRAINFRRRTRPRVRAMLRTFTSSGGADMGIIGFKCPRAASVMIRTN